MKLIQRAVECRPICEGLERRQMLSAGDPDLSFGTNGAALLGFQGPLAAPAYAVTVDNQGRTIIAGDAALRSSVTVIFAARYLPNGSLDNSFGNGGEAFVTAGFQDEAFGVATDSSGRVIIAGTTTAAYDPNYHTADFLVARLNTDGSMDTSFNGNGEAIIDFAGGQDEANTVLVQPDGKILVAGNGAPGLNLSSQMAIARLNTDGTLDTSFGAAGTGKVLTNASTGSNALYGLVLDSSGRIVATGYAGSSVTSVALVRYNSNGILDSTFGSGGIVLTAPGANVNNHGRAVDITPGGQIAVAGYGETYNTSSFSFPTGFDVLVGRYNSDGSLDSSFGSGGYSIIDYNSKNQYPVAIRALSDNDVAVAGYDQSAAGNYQTLSLQLTSSGALDTNYQGTGRAAVVLGQYIASTIAADGTVTEAGAAGNAGNSIAVARTTATGAVDTSFGTQGLVTTSVSGAVASTGAALALQTDGKSVAVGYAQLNTGNVFAVARLNVNGTPDTTFGNAGTTTISFNGIDDRATSVVIQPDGKIVVAGYTNSGTSAAQNYDFAVVRLNADGSIDTTFGNYGKVVIDQLLQYPAYQKTQDYASSVVLTPDGRIVLGGYTTQNNGSFYVLAVARLTSSGGLDTTLNGSGRANVQDGARSAVGYSVAVDSSGRILIGGYGAPTTGADGFELARLNASGTLDTTFGASGISFNALGGDSSILRSLAIQPDGRIDAGGYASVGGYKNFAVARYTANGVLDPSFNGSGYALMNVSSFGVGAVVPLSDGGILASGGSGKVTLVKFTSMGQLDSSFGTNGVASSNVGLGAISALVVPPVALVRPNGAIVTADSAEQQTGTGFVAAVEQFQGNVAPATASITGNVFADWNGDGIQQNGEPGIVAETVYLDLNGDSTLDANDPRVVPTASGAFNLTGLTPGQYVVRILINAGFYPTTPAAVSITASSSSIATVTFGVAIYSTITGEVYNDTLGTGFSTGNAGEPGVSVYLDLNEDGNLDAGDPFAVSDSNGNYSIANCPAGTFALRELLPAGNIITQPSGNVYPGYYNISLGVLLPTAKPFGNFKLGTASGTVFNDLNGNGVQDGSEPGLAGWTVFADVNGTGVLAGNDPTAVTGSSGHYAISNLGPGLIQLNALPQPGFSVSANSSSTRVTSGDNIAFSFPAQSTSGSIVGTVYVDSTGYGRTANEQSGNSVMTEVYIDTNNNGQLDPGEPTAFFNSNANVTFSNLSSGTYTIRQSLLGTTWLQTIPASNSGVTVTVTAGQAATFTVANFQLQSVLGRFNTSAATGSGTVPVGTPLVVSINSPSGVITNHTVGTDANGLYQLGNLGPGIITVTPGVPSGYSVTPTSASAAGLSGASTTLNFTAVASGSISGTVFSDDNDNGVQDSGELSLAGVSVYLDLLSSPSGTPIFTLSTATGAGNGNYTFTNIAPGYYTVREPLPSAYARLTTPVAGSYSLTPFSPVTSTNINFGDLPYVPNRQLSGTVIGTTGSYNNSGNTIAKAFDGNFITYFDAPTASGSWAGLDLGAAKIITQVSYASRSGWAGRMNGGTFQGSSSANFSSGVVNLFVIGSNANVSSTSLTNSAVSVTTPYRYVRYIGPANAYCDVSELEFFGYSPAAVSVTGINFNGNASTQSLTISLSNSLLADPGVSAISLLNVTNSTATTVPSSDLAENYNASNHTMTITFPGFTGGKLPAGIYQATLIASAVTDSNGYHPASNVSYSFLTIPSGKLTLATGRGTVSVQQVNILSGAELDIANNNLILTGGGAGGYASLLQLIQSGFQNGTWQGSTGIASSAAAGSSQHLTGLALVLSTGQPFESLSTQVGDVLLKYTYYGDANLDGKVDGSDYSLIDNGFANHLTGWANGDFNDDGIVDGSDYALMDNVFNQQGARLAAQIAVEPAKLISPRVSPTFSNVVIGNSSFERNKTRNLFDELIMN